jgi:hypothetical protein
MPLGNNKRLFAYLKKAAAYTNCDLGVLTTESVMPLQ